jgi:Tol biopolymer transport system component
MRLRPALGALALCSLCQCGGSNEPTAPVELQPSTVRIVFVYRPDALTASIGTATLDGAGLRRGAEANYISTYPSLSPTNDLVAYHQSEQGDFTIVLSEAGGPPRRLLDATLPYGLYPRFSRDGQYVYFAGRAQFDQPYEIWRIRVTGTGLERLTRASATSGSHTQPSPSPDGSKLAYHDDQGLHVLTQSTGAKLTLSPDGQFPAFSPDGRRIAFSDYTGFHVINVDGTGFKTLESERYYEDRSAWLPDGKWVLMRSRNGVEQVEATSGEKRMLNALDAYLHVTPAP